MISLHIFWLSIIQGLTEFLPVSSSGHLILFAKYTHFSDQGQTIDIALHIGSLIAVVYYFWKTIKGMIVDLFRHYFMPKLEIENIRLAYYLIIATIPAIVIGGILSYFGMDWVRSAKLIGWTLIIYSLFLWFADTKFSTKKNLSDMHLWEALAIGFAQCLAFIPGTSRSGVTITTGRFLGFNRSEIAKFSMLLSIPSILAAGILAAYHVYQNNTMEALNLAYQAIGMSFIFSFLAIFLMMKWLRFATFLPFVIYRIILGLLLIADAYGWF
jgi:undecaprenyl-diphosphatase